jgi:hypothetical protein
MQRWLITFCAVAFFMASAPVHAQNAGLSSVVSEVGDPREKVQYVRNALEEMMSGLKSVSKLQEVARRQNDEEMIRCVQNKLSNVRALMMVSERASGAMKEAQAVSNAKAAEHEFVKVVVSLARVRQFVSDAAGCVGEGASSDGTSEVQVTQSGLKEGDDSDTEFDNYFLVIGVDPVDVSPFN